MHTAQRKLLNGNLFDSLSLTIPEPTQTVPVQNEQSTLRDVVHAVATSRSSEDADWCVIWLTGHKRITWILCDIAGIQLPCLLVNHEYLFNANSCWDISPKI